MQFRLRTLLIVLAVGPVVLAATYWQVQEWRARRAEPLAQAAASAKAEQDRLAIEALNRWYASEVSGSWQHHYEPAPLKHYGGGATRVETPSVSP